MASTKDRQRALERARYERVQAKMQKKHREAKRKQRVAIVSSIAAIAVIGGVLAGVFALTGSSTKTTAAVATTASASASASSTAAGDTCAAAASIAAETKGYRKCGTAAKSGIGIPTYSAAAATTYTATIDTNRGNIVMTLDGKDAPYTVESFVYLADKSYFDSTKCHRLTTSGIYVLQCGDPTGTGSGGPGYAFQDENLASLGTAGSSGTVTYKAGTIAMANSGFGTNGSQFFLVYKDSPLAANYTPFGTITQGLNVLQAIAAKGSNNANATGDGAPNESVEISKVTIKQD